MNIENVRLRNINLIPSVVVAWKPNGANNWLAYPFTKRNSKKLAPAKLLLCVYTFF